MSSEGDVKEIRTLNVPFRRPARLAGGHSERLENQSVISVHVVYSSKVLSL